MPKFIGRTIHGATQIEDNAFPSGMIRLSYSQARLLPEGDVICSLDTTDRGFRGSLAKRWYRWFASPAAVLACSQSTRNMLAAARVTVGWSMIACDKHDDCKADIGLAHACHRAHRQDDAA